MTLKKWIEAQGGPRALGRLLGVESPTIYAWLRGDATPSALRMQELVKLSKGQLTYDIIINETMENKKRRSRQQQVRA